MTGDDERQGEEQAAAGATPEAPRDAVAGPAPPDAAAAPAPQDDAAAPAPPMPITVVRSARQPAAEPSEQRAAGGPSASGSAGGSSASGSAGGPSTSGFAGGPSAAGPASASSASGSTSRRLRLAVTFLTGIPLRVEGEASPSDLWGSMGWYPLVGLLMGFAAWVVYAGLVSFLPGLVAATLVVILLELLTRGLHLDGLMDTADGILSGAPRARALEIMKDHNVGAMGVASAVLLLVLKIAALGALSRADAAAPLIAGWCAARALPALDVYHWPYARAAGTGEAFTREHTPQPLQLAAGLLVAGIVVAGLAALVAGGAGSWSAGLMVAAVAIAATLAVQASVARRLGGMTGDVYGMGIELAEAAALVMGCAIVGLAM